MSYLPHINPITPPPTRLDEAKDWAEFVKRYLADHGQFRESLRKWIVGTNTTLDDHETRIDALEDAPGGAGGNSGTFEVDFGATLSFETTATVAATWVTAASEIVFAPNHTATTDHTVEETLVEGVTVAVTTLTAGVSFAVLAIAPTGTTGKHRFSYVGV